MTFLKTGFTIVILLHAIIHVLGFIKAYDFIEVPQLSLFISKPLGWLWFLAFLILIVTFISIWLNKDWSTLALIGVVLSQTLIFFAWSDAKFGTLPNVIILAVALVSIMNLNFKKSYLSDASESILRSEKAEHETLVNSDIFHLPIPVQKYLHFVDVVGKPKIRNMKVIIKGQMRSREGDWFNFNSEQYNTFDQKERLFFMEAIVKKLPTNGYHLFKDNVARITIKILSIFPVVDESSKLLKQAETVTLFNDICIMAPADLINQDIKWEEIDENQVKAYFTNDGITISAKLYFDNDGALVNFYSDDRIDIKDKKAYGFSTPITGYEEQNGYMRPTYGEAIWHYPEGVFVYGKFNIQSIQYNVKRIQH